ncbi:MAG: hypothetical protein ACI4PR_02180 [Acutalibacteraceae bacterium]
MFRNLKNSSKLLLLALLFSSSWIFSTFAAEPHKPNSTTQAQQAQKRKREDSEKTRQEAQRLNELYDFGNALPILFKTSPPYCVHCELQKESGNFCNRSLKYFHLVPERRSGKFIPIGCNCYENFSPNKISGSISKKIRIAGTDESKDPKSERDADVAAQILAYFFDQRNWNKLCRHKNINGKDVAPANRNGNFILSVVELKDYLRSKGYVISDDNKELYLNKKSNTTYQCKYKIPDEKNLTNILSRHNNIVKTNDRSPFLDFYYRTPVLTSLISFDDNEIPLSNDKIFKAFEFFCAVYNIYQPFKMN